MTRWWRLAVGALVGLIVLVTLLRVQQVRRVRERYDRRRRRDSKSFHRRFAMSLEAQRDLAAHLPITAARLAVLARDPYWQRMIEWYAVECASVVERRLYVIDAGAGSTPPDPAMPSATTYYDLEIRLAPARLAGAALRTWKRRKERAHCADFWLRLATVPHFLLRASAS